MIIALINRLRSQCPLFAKIEPWLDVETQEFFPVLAVQLTDEDSTPSEGLSSSLQVRTMEFSLLIGTSQIDIQSATDPLTVARNEINAALQGWVPAAGYDAFQHNSGTIVNSDAYRVWWQDLYSVSYLSKG